MATAVNKVPSTAPPTFVVIGYGKRQQGDDAIGAAVVSQLQALSIPHLEAYAVTQLTPELSGKLAAADYAIFVDACKLPDRDQVRVKGLEARGSETPGSAVPAFGHGCDPGSLLALTHSVYGRCPQAWWVEVPASDFVAGHPLSASAENGITQALQTIQALIETLTQAQCL
jgi:hydrogenase maturation protease